MAYILNKTNGAIIATVQDSQLDNSTDLTFVGRNFAGYGEIQNENFLKLLENFSNFEEPLRPIQGQLWYDSANNVLCIYDGSYWKGIANLDIKDVNPIGTKDYKAGDLWYNNVTQQLNVFNGTNFIVVGPPSNADAFAGWRGDFEYLGNSPIYNIKAVVGVENEVIAIASDRTYYIESQYDVSPGYPQVGITPRLVKGITLSGADPITGSSKSTGNYFWGTAAESLKADRASVADYSNGFAVVATNTNVLHWVPFVSTSSNTSASVAYVDNGMKYNPSTNILYVTASSALYSDIAERYHADNNYDEGTVLSIGGKFDVTICQIDADVSVAGIVSLKPAYRMNEEAGSDETHPFIALKGRVPCKIVGRIRKGDLIVSCGRYPGYGRAIEEKDNPNAAFAKSLESKNSDSTGTIEVMVF